MKAKPKIAPKETFVEKKANILRRLHDDWMSLFRDTLPAETDEDLHTFLVASEAEKFFCKLKEAVHKKMVKAYDKGNMSPGSTYVLTSSGLYSFVVTIKNPAHRLDATKFVVELAKRGVKQEVIDAAYTAATVANNPARVYGVAGNE